MKNINNKPQITVQQHIKEQWIKPQVDVAAIDENTLGITGDGNDATVLS